MFSKSFVNYLNKASHKLGKCEFSAQLKINDEYKRKSTNLIKTKLLSGKTLTPSSPGPSN